MLLYAEHLTRSFHHHAQVHIQRRSIGREAVIICVLDVSSGPLTVLVAHPFLNVFRIQILHPVETAARVNLRLRVTVTVYNHESRHTGRFGHLGIISTESRRDMHNTGTFLGGYIITRNNPECTLIRTEPWNQLLIAHSDKFASFHFSRKNLERDFLGEEFAYQILGHDVSGRSSGIWIGRFYLDVCDVRTNAKRCV